MVLLIARMTVLAAALPMVTVCGCCGGKMSVMGDAWYEWYIAMSGI